MHHGYIVDIHYTAHLHDGGIRAVYSSDVRVNIHNMEYLYNRAVQGLQTAVQSNTLLQSSYFDTVVRFYLAE